VNNYAEKTISMWQESSVLQKQMYEGGGNKKQKWKKQTRPENLSLGPNMDTSKN
jgi:hypothetical protein